MTPLVYGGGGGHNDADDNGYDSSDDNSDVLMMITLDIAVELVVVPVVDATSIVTQLKFLNTPEPGCEPPGAKYKTSPIVKPDPASIIVNPFSLNSS